MNSPVVFLSKNVYRRHLNFDFILLNHIVSQNILFYLPPLIGVDLMQYKYVSEVFLCSCRFRCRCTHPTLSFTCIQNDVMMAKIGNSTLEPFSGEMFI